MIRKVQYTCLLLLLVAAVVVYADLPDDIK